MPLYAVSSSALTRLDPSTLTVEGWRERDDLQRFLRDAPGAIEDGLMVIAEEYSDWEGSSRRVDLLCLDATGQLVVVELKRTEDGGFMDLQSIRYAAMVANMKLDRLVDAHRKYLLQRGFEGDAYQLISDHLQQDLSERVIDTSRPRILLVSSGFSRELTTSVLWLNDSGLDIRCIRVQPYRIGSEFILDVTQVLPLPEAEDYLVRMRERAAEVEAATGSRRERTITTLLREGLIEPGTPLVICARTIRQEVSLADPMFRARINSDPTTRKNVIWEHDGQSYSLSGLSEMLRAEHNVPFPAGAINGYWHWALESDPDHSLWELAERLGRQGTLA